MQAVNPVFQALFEDPSNRECFECKAKNVQWASVNNGIFICMNCSGRHRGFTVELSFVRSTTMDEWSDKQLQKMRLGGNAKLTQFLSQYQIAHEPAADKYKTKACRWYREMVFPNPKLKKFSLKLNQKVSQCKPKHPRLKRAEL
jgi:ADP-ribosylation factor GTPase-activating protein 1